jgi:hypothetical protein
MMYMEEKCYFLGLKFYRLIKTATKAEKIFFQSLPDVREDRSYGLQAAKYILAPDSTR